MRHVLEALFRQIGRNQGRNLLHPQVRLALEVDPMFLAAIEEIRSIHHSGSGEALVSKLVKAAVEWLVDRMYTINQYVQVSQLQEDVLAGIYRQAWEALLDHEDVEAVLRSQHYPLAHKWVASLYPASLRRRLGSVRYIGRVACQEYSAGFQVGLYGLDVRTIVPPVLDLGCGRHAQLVRHLRNAGIDAFGVDSFVAQYDQHRVPAWRLRYQELLESSNTGGTFHYGPCAPELELMVDRKRFTVATGTAGGAFQTTRITRVASQGQGVSARTGGSSTRGCGV